MTRTSQYRAMPNAPRDPHAERIIAHRGHDRPPLHARWPSSEEVLPDLPQRPDLPSAAPTSPL